MRCWLLLGAVAKLELSGFTEFGRKQGDAWMYIGKFGYARGEGKWSVRARLAPRPDVKTPYLHSKVEVYLDNDYEDIMAATPCERNSYAKGGGRQLAIPTNGNWSIAVAGKLTQVVRPHVWYFAISACANQTRGPITMVDANAAEKPRDPTRPSDPTPAPSTPLQLWELDVPVSLDVEFSAQQEGGSEMSYEDYGLRVLYFFALCGYVALALYLRPQYARASRGGEAVHPVLAALGGAVALEGASYTLKFMDIAKYHSDGCGFPWLYGLALVLDPASQAILMGFMWLLACGYTILGGRDLPDQVKLATAGAVALVYMVLVVFDGSSSHHAQWYPHEGLSGYLMVAMRLCVFAVSIPSALGTLAATTAPKAKAFLRLFFVASAGYVLALPLCMLVAALFAPYYRKFVMELFHIGIQGVSVAVLSRQVVARGDYYRVSSLGATVLPGGKDH